MKIIVAVVLLLISLPACADHDPWTDADTARQAAYLALVYADVRQTLEMERDGWTVNGNNVKEDNRILGQHPSRRRIISYAAGGALLHTGITYALPRWARTPVQYISILAEADTVNRNYRLGIRVGTRF